jgi:hypothetical protein
MRHLAEETATIEPDGLREFPQEAKSPLNQGLASRLRFQPGALPGNNFSICDSFTRKSSRRRRSLRQSY